nr:DsbA family protein [uncultured Cupriavidus sp.]
MTLTYLLDPLCGWCYGAGAPLTQIVNSTGLQLTLLPTGLFSAEGARAMDDKFAAYAWANDQRIERLTGQVFSERYRDQVLGNRAQPFDSGPATVALTAVHLSAPEREFEALKAIQRARYVDGLDITDLTTLVEVLASLGLTAASARVGEPDTTLLQATQDRMSRGRTLLHQLGAQGVPTFALDNNGRSRMLHASQIFSDLQAFARELNEAH